MVLTHRLSWKRLRKFLCAGRKKEQTDSQSAQTPALTDADCSVSKGVSIPVQTVRAAVSEMPRFYVPEVPSRKTFHDYWLRFRVSDFCFYARYFARKIMLGIAIILLVILGLEALFWLWVLLMTPQQFQQFTACLDAGVVPSFKERFLYHIACFWGNL